MSTMDVIDALSGLDQAMTPDEAKDLIDEAVFRAVESGTLSESEILNTAKDAIDYARKELAES